MSYFNFLNKFLDIVANHDIFISIDEDFQIKSFCYCEDCSLSKEDCQKFLNTKPDSILNCPPNNQNLFEFEGYYVIVEKNTDNCDIYLKKIV